MLTTSAIFNVFFIMRIKADCCALGCLCSEVLLPKCNSVRCPISECCFWIWPWEDHILSPILLTRWFASFCFVFSIGCHWIFSYQRNWQAAEFDSNVLKVPLVEFPIECLSEVNYFTAICQELNAKTLTTELLLVKWNNFDKVTFLLKQIFNLSFFRSFISWCLFVILFSLPADFFMLL